MLNLKLWTFHTISKWTSHVAQINFFFKWLSLLQNQFKLHRNDMKFRGSYDRVMEFCTKLTDSWNFFAGNCKEHWAQIETLYNFLTWAKLSRMDFIICLLNHSDPWGWDAQPSIPTMLFGEIPFRRRSSQPAMRNVKTLPFIDALTNIVSIVAILNIFK